MKSNRIERLAIKETLTRPYVHPYPLGITLGLLSELPLRDVTCFRGELAD